MAPLADQFIAGSEGGGEDGVKVIMDNEELGKCGLDPIDGEVWHVKMTTSW